VRFLDHRELLGVWDAKEAPASTLRLVSRAI
jgi:hypothetical protein